MREHKCEKKIWDRFHYHLCGKTARYEHEGKWYCKTHHPPTRKAYEDARNEKWQAKWDAQEQASREADKARAEMQRKSAAYDGLVAQRDALLEALVKCRDRFFPADQPEQDRDELWGPVNAAIKAVEGEKE